MDLRERLLQAMEVLSAHPRRVLASSLGVFWGAAAIILMLAWGTGFRSYMYDELQRYGRPMLFMAAGITSSGFPGHRAGVRIRITREDVAVAEASNAQVVAAILPEHLSNSGERVLVQVGNRVRRMDLSGVDHRFAEYRNFHLGHGRFFDASDVERRRAVAVLGYEAAEELYGDARAALGRRIRIDGQSFKVIGVADPKGRQYFNTNRPDNRLLMVPVTTAEARLGYDEDRVERWSIYLRPRVEPGTALRAVVATLASRAGFHPDDTDAVRWFDLSAMLGLVDLLYQGFFVFIGLAGTITLLVAGVGIANFHLATLADRTVEIGVAKALGATHRTLALQTLLESLIVSAAASGLGVGFGLLGCLAIEWFAPAGLLPTPVISAPVVLVTGIALIGVTGVSGSIPAFRVRKMEVSAALRLG
ncbi:MAG: ABC transporter permease [Myxococcota bacterium]